MRDLEHAGFPLPGRFEVDWSDRRVRCRPGHVCASPVFDGERQGTLILAPEALLSDATLRLALLEVWQRMSDGGAMQGPWALARSTLRQLVSGPRVGVSDPVLLAEVLRVYAGHRSELSEEERAGLPDPEVYSRELGRFLAPVPLAEPGSRGERSFAPRALGPVSVADCEEASGYLHAGYPGWEGRSAYWRGLCAAEEGELASAIELLLRAEQLLVHDPRVPRELGDVLCLARHHKAAVLAFERAADKSTNDLERAEAYRGIARCRLRGGDAAGARRAYREALALDPEEPLTAAWVRSLEEQGLLPAEPP
jgi:hypothetical protein